MKSIFTDIFWGVGITIFAKTERALWIEWESHRDISLRASSLSVWMPRENLLIQMSINSLIYDSLISSGLDSRVTSEKTFGKSGKTEKISEISEGVSTEGVPQPKYKVWPSHTSGKSWKYSLISFLRYSMYRFFLNVSKIGVKQICSTDTSDCKMGCGRRNALD